SNSYRQRLWHDPCYLVTNAYFICGQSPTRAGIPIMWLYFFKRLLIMVPTLIGVLTLTFAVTQFLPGGPIDHVMSSLDGHAPSAGTENGAGSGWTYSGRVGIDPAQVEQLKQLY